MTSIGAQVHYLSFGSPPNSEGEQTYKSKCRLAFVTEVGENDIVGLMVCNPTGMFFRPLSEGGSHHQENERVGGSWHWPQHGCGR